MSATSATSAMIRRTTHALLAALAGLVVVLGLQVVTVGGAEAYTITAQGGVSSTQRPTIYKATGTHINIGTPHSAQWVRRVNQPGPVVRHTTGGDQVVKVTYRVYKSTGGSWSLEQTYAASRTLGAGYSSLQMPPLRHDSYSRGYFYVQVQLQWTSPVGGLQSHFTATMNQAGDYACNSQHQCTVGNGYVYLS